MGGVLIDNDQPVRGLGDHVGVVQLAARGAKRERFGDRVVECVGRGRRVHARRRRRVVLGPRLGESRALARSARLNAVGARCCTPWPALGPRRA